MTFARRYRIATPSKCYKQRQGQGLSFITASGLITVAASRKSTECFLEDIMALIYQMRLETDSGVKIIVCQNQREINEMYISGQFQHTNQQLLTNMAAENNRHLNIPPLFTYRLTYK